MLLTRQPVLCNYYVTYRCNAKCGFCDIWEKPSPYITLADVEANLRDLKKMKVKVVDFTGGEPLLHRQLPEFVQMAKQLGFITTVTTNGMLYPKQAERLKGWVDMLHFSIDSANAELHDTSRGVQCFDLLMQSLDLAQQLGERPDLLLTVFDHNLHEVEEVYRRIAQPRGLTMIVNPVFEYNGVGESLSQSALKTLRQWATMPGVYLNEAFLDLRLAGGNVPQHPVCQAGTATIVISPENELVLPCYHLGLEKIPINGQLQQIWEGTQAAEMRKMAGKLDACKGCSINCYMEPSMAVDTGKHFWPSFRSTFRYAVEKWVYS